MNETAPLLSPCIQPYIDRHELAGAVMFVADKEGMLAAEAIGWADLGAKIPMAADSLFWIASQSKPVTAVALMMLVEEGKLTVDDPVEKHLPEFAGQMVAALREPAEVVLRKPARPPTVKDLFLHTSGLPFATPLEQPALDLLPLWARVRSYAMSPLEFEPGSSILYSNAGTNTAARIVEVISGQAFEQFLDERLLQPLGMRDTTFWPDERQVARLAESYRANPGEDPEDGDFARIPIEYLHYPLKDRAKRFAVPAGGLFSTAADLVRFYRMILNGGSLDGRDYLSPKTVGEMTRRHTPDSFDRAQGYGFEADGKTFGHGGAYSTYTGVNLTSGLILGWLVQHASFRGKGGEARGAFEKAALEKFGKL